MEMPRGVTKCHTGKALLFFSVFTSFRGQKFLCLVKTKYVLFVIVIAHF